ncbi:GxxExxY protein [bacterium]|nr:GxxExxY protein [bacterium]MDA7645632.1 GxxExxY protein [bacterium]MDB4798795.1 GxxExxY protein [Verrucomicrobiota bacterium]
MTSDVIGAARHVLNELRPGLDKKLYENALVIELEERGYRIEQQRSFDGSELFFNPCYSWSKKSSVSLG